MAFSVPAPLGDRWPQVVDLSPPCLSQWYPLLCPRGPCHPTPWPLGSPARDILQAAGGATVGMSGLSLGEGAEPGEG